VHLLLRLPANLDLSKALQWLKGSSSHWAGERGHDFSWQQGYAAFSISFSGLDQVRRYILNQKQHHAKISFEDEFRLLLQRHGVEYDEQYVFG
jgi:putative transposase